MNAWLITWEGLDRRITDSNRIVAVLSSRMSSSAVEDLIDVLYQRSHCAVFEMAHLANRKRERRGSSRMLCSSLDRIFYGTADRFLYGRLISSLSVREIPDTGIETLKWIERPLYKQNATKGYSIEIVEEAKPMEITRPFGKTLESVFVD
jgi:hypothetical protein